MEHTERLMKAQVKEVPMRVEDFYFPAQRTVKGSERCREMRGRERQLLF